MADQMEDKLQIRLHVYDTDLTVRIPREDNSSPRHPRSGWACRVFHFPLCH